MAVPGIYRRALPSPPAIEFASPQGKQLFSEALHGGTMGCFFKLMSYYQTQSEPAYCGLASLSMVLNALAIDPRRTWKGPWRWFDDSMLDCCESLDNIKQKGITFGKVACLAYCNGAKADSFRTTESSVDDFRTHVVSCASSENCHVIVSYNRKAFNQTGSGHFSPIGGYHTRNDMVLILDVARFKYPPHWVPLTLLWEAMDTVDEATRQRRGFMIISRLDQAPSVLYTMSCRDEGWKSVTKYLTEDVPLLFRTKDMKDVEDILAIVFRSPPSGLKEFIRWVAEVRRQEDGETILSEEEKGRLAIKEEVLKQVRETELFNYVSRWLLSESAMCRCATFSDAKDTLPEIAANVCCQGAKVLSGNISSDCISLGKAGVKFLEGDGEKPVTMVQGTVITDSAGQSIDVLVPLSQTKPNSLCGFDQNGCSGMHPRTGDALTVLTFSLPQNAWSTIKEEKVREQMNSLVSVGNLPPLLQEEVMHLRRQLHFLMTDLNPATPS
uniref:glutathione gamma-glutamylcysteinyltransferase n=1 Tax=Kandelia candel TaxID=61147 RepID=V5IU49_9ROSI|nr:phytochelatin synthase [Kandelia candel]